MPPGAGEPVLDRAFRLVTAFDADTRTLSLTALSQRADMPKSTTLRLARKLVDLGVLERTDDGLFVVGLRLLEFASLAPRGHGLRATAMPYLEDLHHATGQHVLLAVRDGHDAVLVERLSSRVAGKVMYRIGGRLPLHATGVGLVLLAHAPAGFQEEVLNRPLRLMPENGDMSPAELRKRLAAVRHHGVAIISRPLPEPMTSVAAPVRGDRQTVVAALSVVAPERATDPTTLRPAVIAIARAISRAIQP